MIHEGRCSLWDSLEECWVEVSWSTQGQRSPYRMRTLWPRPTETLPRNMMLYFSLQQMWPWMQPQLILPSSCLKKGNELPGKRSVKIQKKKKCQDLPNSTQRFNSTLHCAWLTEHQLKEILLGGAGWEHLFLGPRSL